MCNTTCIFHRECSGVEIESVVWSQDTMPMNDTWYIPHWSDLHGDFSRPLAPRNLYANHTSLDITCIFHRQLVSFIGMCSWDFVQLSHSLSCSHGECSGDHSGSAGAGHWSGHQGRLAQRNSWQTYFTHCLYTWTCGGEYICLFFKPFPLFHFSYRSVTVCVIL